MSKLLATIALAVSAFGGAAVCSPSDGQRDGRVDLAMMNLAPTGAVDRALPPRDFVPDKTPTSFDYALPASGMNAVVGYRTSNDSHAVQGYEVNQATALGFSQPASSVGAGLAYRF